MQIKGQQRRSVFVVLVQLGEIDDLLQFLELGQSLCVERMLLHTADDTTSQLRVLGREALELGAQLGRIVVLALLTASRTGSRQIFA